VSKKTTARKGKTAAKGSKDSRPSKEVRDFATAMRRGQRKQNTWLD
jgi:hypothetical protein